MIWKRDDWLTYLAVMLTTVIVLVCGQLLWHKYAVTKPLDKGLQAIQGVEAVKWAEDDKSGVVSINITLNQVDDLQKTYGEITDTSKRILGRKVFRVLLNDHRSPELAGLYYNVHYAVQEAICTGNFTSMAGQIQAQAKAVQAEAKIYVDAGYVYLQFNKGADALYMVAPRQTGGQEVRQ